MSNNVRACMVHAFGCLAYSGLGGGHPWFTLLLFNMVIIGCFFDGTRFVQHGSFWRNFVSVSFLPILGTALWLFSIPFHVIPAFLFLYLCAWVPKELVALSPGILLLAYALLPTFLVLAGMQWKQARIHIQTT